MSLEMKRKVTTNLVLQPATDLLGRDDGVFGELLPLLLHVLGPGAHVVLSPDVIITMGKRTTDGNTGTVVTITGNLSSYPDMDKAR